MTNSFHETFSHVPENTLSLGNVYSITGRDAFGVNSVIKNVFRVLKTIKILKFLIGKVNMK